MPSTAEAWAVLRMLLREVMSRSVVLTERGGCLCCPRFVGQPANELKGLVRVRNPNSKLYRMVGWDCTAGIIAAV